MNIKKEKETFMYNMGVSKQRREEGKLEVAMADSINSAVTTRSCPAYSPDASISSKAKFRKDWKEAVRQTAEKYKGKRVVSDNDHIGNIQKIAKDMSRKHRGVLLNGKMRFGISQKALNLYLKHLWCLGKLAAEPPHCPVDRYVLHRFTDIGGNWTEMDSVSVYRKWVAGCKEAAEADKLSIPAWELWKFNHKDD